MTMLSKLLDQIIQNHLFSLVIKIKKIKFDIVRNGLEKNKGSHTL